MDVIERERAPEFRSCPHRPRHDDGRVYAALLDAGHAGGGSAARARQTDPRDERGFRALSRRIRPAAGDRLSLPASRRADASGLGRGRRYPLRLSRLEIRLRRAMQRAAGRGGRVRPQGPDQDLSDPRASRHRLRLFRRGRAAALPALPGAARRGADREPHPVVPCNWLQCFENSLDEVHVAFVHRIGGSHSGIYDLPEIGAEDTTGACCAPARAGTRCGSACITCRTAPGSSCRRWPGSTAPAAGASCISPFCRSTI